MKSFARNYILNFFFFPLFTAISLGAVYLYSPDRIFSEISEIAAIQTVASGFVALICMILQFLIGHLGNSIYRVEVVRNQQILNSLGEQTREKIFNIFLEKGSAALLSEYNPVKYYVAAGIHAALAVILPVAGYHVFRADTLPVQVIDILKVLSVLNAISFWIFFNFFRKHLEGSLRTLKRLSDRCLYYSGERLRSSQIFNTISDVVKIFNESQSLDPVFQKVLSDCIRLMNLDVGVMEVFHEETSTRMHRVVVPADNAITLGEDFMEVVIGRSEVHNNLGLSHAFKPLAEQGFYSMIHVGLDIHGREVGYMAGFSRSKRDLRDADLEFFYTYGRQTSMIIENAFLLEKVKHLSVTDGLTGLFNHRYFKDAIKTEVRRAVRYGKSLCVVMVDIDHFKHYNDTNGHPAGDRVLQKVAGILRELTRDTDIVARYGGEEFVMVLTETTKEGGAEFARRLCVAVEKEPFENKREQPGGNLTVSVGVTACSVDATEPEILVDFADKCLYKAKRLGRNRVVVYEKGLEKESIHPATENPPAPTA